MTVDECCQIKKGDEWDSWPMPTDIKDRIRTAIQEAVVREREACAQLVVSSPEYYLAEEIAAAIRARST